MRKVFVNGVVSLVRVLSPIAYKDPIKSLDKSNEARVELDGVRAFRSCVTSGRDVKNAANGMKYHVYFYMTKEAAEARDTSRREFMPISAEEFRAYREDPAYTFVLATVPMVAAPETEVVVAEIPANEGTPETVAPETEVVPAEAPANEGTKPSKRRK